MKILLVVLMVAALTAMPSKSQSRCPALTGTRWEKSGGKEATIYDLINGRDEVIAYIVNGYGTVQVNYIRTPLPHLRWEYVRTVGEGKRKIYSFYCRQ